MAYEKNFKAGIIVRYSMDGLREKHPNMWVSMKDCEFEKNGNIKS